LRLVLLSLIAEQPRHGYDLIREIEERTGGQYAPSPGVIYPTLTMLQDMGLIAEEGAAGTRKVYAVTAEGTAHLAEKKAEVAALLARIAELADAQKGDRAPVRRALRNLHAALADKVARSDNDELMHKIAALLDEATQKIERS
jgi:DNA-binding PadR family transcriptional regulator